MKKLLVILLTLVMLVSVLTACGEGGGNATPSVDHGGNSNNNTTNNDNATNNNNTPSGPIEDEYYEPATENLVGVALYPVEDKNDYQYELGEKVTDMSKWKFIYKIDENTYAYDDNIVKRAEGRGVYVSDKDYYWGYVYCENGSYYIIATHDYCDCDGGEDYRSCVGPINLTGYVIDTVPDGYAFEYSWFNFLTTEMRDCVEYKDSECPAAIVLPDKQTYNMLCIKYMFNGQKIDPDVPLDSDIWYDNVKDAGGTISWAFDGYKDGESYQYYIEVTHPDFADNGQN